MVGVVADRTGTKQDNSEVEADKTGKTGESGRWPRIGLARRAAWSKVGCGDGEQVNQIEKPRADERSAGWGRLNQRRELGVGRSFGQDDGKGLARKMRWSNGGGFPWRRGEEERWRVG